MKLLPLFVCLAVLPAMALACSCVADAFSQSRVAVIKDAFRNENIPDIFSAVVIGAVCNCVVEPNARPFAIACQNYSLEGDEVDYSLLAAGTCHSTSWSYSIQSCGSLQRTITLGRMLNAIGTTSTPTGDNANLTTDTGCSLTCPFNSGEQNDGLDFGFDFGLEIQPCLYTVRVTEVFKGDLTNGTVLNTTGPDVVTSCGSNRLLRLGEEYLVGVGGACNPIDAWSTLDQFSVEFLRNPEASNNALLALLVILLPSAIVAVSLGVTFCVYYGRRHHKPAPHSSDSGTVLSPGDTKEGAEGEEF